MIDKSRPAPSRVSVMLWNWPYECPSCKEIALYRKSDSLALCGWCGKEHAQHCCCPIEDWRDVPDNVCLVCGGVTA